MLANTKTPLAFDRATVTRLASGAGAYGIKGLVALSRAYLGTLAGHGSLEKSGAIGVLTMALAKLTFEAGELALHNPTLAAGAPVPEFKVDEAGRAPGLSLAHVLAVRQLWMARSDEKAEAKTMAVQTAAPRTTASQRRQTARTQYYAAGAQGYAYRAAPAYASASTRETSIMATSNSYSRAGTPSVTGCSSCGKSHPPPSRPRPPVPDYCGGGIKAAPRAPERASSCGCGGGCSCDPRSRPPADEECAPWCSISCDTKDRLRECVKDALCDFARCLADELDPTTKPPAPVPTEPNPDGTINDVAAARQNPLVACAQQVALNFLRCLPDALCPEECAPSTPAPAECLPCGYAVEVQ